METRKWQSEGALMVSIDIEATPERVFRALTEPAELGAWWDTLGEGSVDEWIIELRVGGRWEVRGRGTDGRLLSVEGEFLVVEAPTRLAFRWRPSWEPGVETTVAYSLEAVPGGTRVTLRHDRASSSSSWPKEAATA